jgi:hypothetical protein
VSAAARRRRRGGAISHPINTDKINMQPMDYAKPVGINGQRPALPAHALRRSV